MADRGSEGRRAAALGAWRHFIAVDDTAERRSFEAGRRALHPRFIEAVAADAREAAVKRGERFDYSGPVDRVLQVVRLCVVTDAFLALVLYRAKAALQARRVPFVPRVLHKAAMSSGQICIGDPVVVHAGIYIPHGQIVIDGVTEVHSRVMIAPFVTVGLIAGEFTGPTLRPGVKVGTGAKILGPIEVGRNAMVGANAVVIGDVEAQTNVVGIPARPIDSDA